MSQELNKSMTMAGILFLISASLLGNPFTISFITLGNCATCEIRIENAVKALSGVDTVHWDQLQHVTTVTYDDAVTDAYVIMNTVAGVGHDNEWFRAPDSAYNLLRGTCCEYDRTINYDTVEVGYLELMGIYLFHLGIQENARGSVTVFPAISTGVFRFTISGMEQYDGSLLSIYSLSGRMVHSQKIQSAEVCTDLGRLPEGVYIAKVVSGPEVMATTRLIRIR